MVIRAVPNAEMDLWLIGQRAAPEGPLKWPSVLCQVHRLLQPPLLQAVMQVHLPYMALLVIAQLLWQVAVIAQSRAMQVTGLLRQLHALMGTWQQVRAMLLYQGSLL